MFSIARYYGGIKAFGKEYIVVDKRGMDMWECSEEAEKLGRDKAIEAGEPADLIDKDYQKIYKKVGRDRFIKMVEKGLDLKGMKKEIKEG